jgi:hypothetical protein
MKHFNTILRVIPEGTAKMLVLENKVIKEVSHNEGLESYPHITVAKARSA